MFCPNCGKADQTINSYCRQCGEFLPDLSGKNKLVIGGNTPEEQIQVNLILNIMSAVVSFVLAAALYITYYGNPEARGLIYIVAAFLLAIGAWQLTIFSVNLKLKKHFKKRKETGIDITSQPEAAQFQTAETKELLPEADFKNIAPESVTEQTTRKLKVNK